MGSKPLAMVGHCYKGLTYEERYGIEIAAHLRKARSLAFSGGNSPMWKGGKVLVQGYVFIHNPSHPFCINTGYVREHRLVMEKHLGRYLSPAERIHHINGNRADNRLENLRLFSSESEHQKFHKRKGRKVIYKNL